MTNFYSKRILIFLAVSLLFLLSGCVTADYGSGYGLPMVNDPPVRNWVTYKEDKFSNSVGFLGVQEVHDEYLGLSQKYFLTSTLLKDTQEVEHILTVFHTYTAYKMIRYDMARSQDTKELEFVFVSREVDSCNVYSDLCSYSEVFGAVIPEEVLRKYKDSGFQVKFYGATNNKVIKVTPNQIQSQFKAIYGSEKQGITNSKDPNEKRITISIPRFIVISKKQTEHKNLEKLSASITKIIEKDLEKSGRFLLLIHDPLISLSARPDSPPRFEDWRSHGSEALVIGEVEMEADGRFRIDFRLWNVSRESQMLGHRFVARLDSWQRVAHLISDEIIEQFSSR